MEKVLIVATVDTHILNFHLPYLKWFKDHGYEVHVASKGKSNIPYTDKKFDIPFERSPYRVQNLIAFRQLREIMSQHHYKLIHCHTPMGAVLTRLAARKTRKQGTKVLYTAHGFHFYKGSAIINWLLYYPIELWLSKYTDCLITINQEDYRCAVNRFRTNSVRFINGVGVDLERFIPQTISQKIVLRREYGYHGSEYILVYAGEMSYRKHQDLLIHTVQLLKREIPNLKLLLAGTGKLIDKYKKMVSEQQLDSIVEFLGHRNDVNKLLLLSDVAVSSSRQEGLPVNILEAMATGLPVVVTDSRGNRDLVKDNENGFVVGTEDADGFALSIYEIYKSQNLSLQFKTNNLNRIKKYSLDKVLKEMGSIYIEYL